LGITSLSISAFARAIPSSFAAGDMREPAIWLAKSCQTPLQKPLSMEAKHRTRNTLTNLAPLLQTCVGRGTNKESVMTRSIFLTAVAASAMALMVGCEGKADKVSGVAPEARQAISAAATARYPGNPTTSRDVQAAAINYPEKKFVEVHNLGNTSIPAGNVWVNGTYMTHIEGIAPRSYTTVQYGQLLEAGAPSNDLKHLNQPVAKVEIQTDKGLFSVQGPTIKND
jgi:hypothetical protein